MRAYKVIAGTDLFGVWLVEVIYGRIGARGRSIRYVAENEAAARRRVNQVLQRRASARQRIGVSYRICQIQDPGKWFPIAVELAEPVARGGGKKRQISCAISR
jgi:hypothetical protein